MSSAINPHGERAWSKLSAAPFSARIGHFDSLELYAVAFSYAQSTYSTGSELLDGLAPVMQEAARCRENLHADVATLTLRGYFSQGLLKDYKGINGYRNMASDLQILTRALRGNWPRVQGKCATQMAEIERAEKLALRILRLVGLREQAPATMAATADARARAFTLFTRSYDEVRRVVSYLRWHQGDADKIAPSLYSGRRKRDANSDMSKTEAQSQPPGEQPQAPPAIATGTVTGPSATQPHQAPQPLMATPSPARTLRMPIPGTNPFAD